MKQTLHVSSLIREWRKNEPGREKNDDLECGVDNDSMSLLSALDRNQSYLRALCLSVHWIVLYKTKG